MPSVITPKGDQFWYKDGVRHRDNDLPAAIYADGDQEWWQNGKLHRDMSEGSSYALPAVIRVNGYAGWWINGEKIKECDDYFPLKSKSARRI